MFSRAARIREPRKVERLLWDADAEAERARDTAAARAGEAARLEATHREAERLAFEAGFAKGSLSNIDQVGNELRRLGETIEQIAALRSVIIRQAERQLVLLASAIAGRILRREVSTDPARLVRIASVAIERLGDRAQATVHLHPDDHAAIVATPAGAQQAIALVPDPAVQPGGCLVQSDLGTIEAGVAAQLEELTAMLLDDALPAAEDGRPSAQAPAA